MSVMLAAALGSKSGGLSWLDRAMARRQHSSAVASAAEAGLEFANEELNTFDAFLKRRKLRQHPRIVRGLQAWWDAEIAKTRSDTLTFEQYKRINRDVFHVLLDDEEYNEEEVDETADEEWADRSESGRMNERQFMNSMYALVDLTVPSLELGAYLEIIEAFCNASVDGVLPGGRSISSSRDPRVPPGGKIGPGGVILDADGKPMRVGGGLSAAEAAELNAAQARLSELKRRQAAGKLTPEELAELEALQKNVVRLEAKGGGGARGLQDQRLAAREAEFELDDQAAALVQAHIRGALARKANGKRRRAGLKPKWTGPDLYREHFYNIGKEDKAGKYPVRKWEFGSGQLLGVFWEPMEALSTLCPMAHARLLTPGVSFEPSVKAATTVLRPPSRAPLKQRKLEPMIFSSDQPATAPSAQNSFSPLVTPRSSLWTARASPRRSLGFSDPRTPSSPPFSSRGVSRPSKPESRASMVNSVERSAWWKDESSATESPPSHARSAVLLTPSPRRAHLRTPASLPNSPRRPKLYQLSGSFRIPLLPMTLPSAAAPAGAAIPSTGIDAEIRHEDVNRTYEPRAPSPMRMPMRMAMPEPSPSPSMLLRKHPRTVQRPQWQSAPVVLSAKTSVVFSSVDSHRSPPPSTAACQALSPPFSPVTIGVRRVAPLNDSSMRWSRTSSTSPRCLDTPLG